MLRRRIRIFGKDMNRTMGENQEKQKNTFQAESMTSVSEREIGHKKGGSFHFSIHLVLLSAIVLVIGFSAFRLP